MPRFDITLKSLLHDADIIFLRLLTGSDVRAWLNVELPRVSNPRVDRLGQTESGDLVQIELQTANDRRMPLRMAYYFLHIYEQYGQAPRQFVLYVGKPALAMPDALILPGFNYQYQLMDIRSLDGKLLLASPNINDNILAILARLKDSRMALHQIVSRIATLKEAERQTALAQLTVLAGLRDLEQAVREEIHTMPATINLLENKVLGPMILEELEKGRQKGRQEGRISVLCRQLEKRFGSLSQSTQDRLAELSSGEFDELSLRVLDAQNIDELFAPQQS